MKRALLALVAAFLACPLAAQVQYNAPERQMPEDVYSAFMSFAELTKQQKQLQAEGMELAAAQQQLLNQAKAQLQGVIVVEVGFDGCPPCLQLLQTLLQPGNDGQSMLQYWKNKGVRFYQLDSNKDSVRRGKKLTTIWKVESAPTLLIFKNGELMIHNFGSGQMQSQLNGFDVNAAGSVLDMLKKWTEFAVK